MNQYGFGSQFSSRFETSRKKNLLTYASNKITINKELAATEKLTTIPHNLGYIPVTMVYGSTDTKVYRALPINTEIAATFLVSVSAEVDEINLYINVNVVDPTLFATSPAYKIDVKYNIFREPIK